MNTIHKLVHWAHKITKLTDVIRAWIVCPIIGHKLIFTGSRTDDVNNKFVIMTNCTRCGVFITDAWAVEPQHEKELQRTAYMAMMQKMAGFIDKVDGGSCG